MLIINRLIIILFLYGCTTRKRCLEKFGQEVVIEKKDTTIYVPQVKVDSVFRFSEITKLQKDTIYLHKDRLNVKLIKQFDTLRLEGECKADTITITKTITQKIEQSRLPFYETFWFYLVLTFILIIGYLLAKRV